MPRSTVPGASPGAARAITVRVVDERRTMMHEYLITLNGAGTIRVPGEAVMVDSDGTLIVSVGGAAIVQLVRDAWDHLGPVYDTTGPGDAAPAHAETDTDTVMVDMTPYLGDDLPSGPSDTTGVVS